MFSRIIWFTRMLYWKTGGDDLVLTTETINSRVLMLLVKISVHHNLSNSVSMLTTIEEMVRCQNTVVCITESKWLDLWSNWPIFDLVFCNIKMPPCSGPLGSTLQLTGALKWGTAWTSSSTGTGITKGQSWTFVFY